MKFNSIVLTFSLLFLLAVFSNELPAQTTTSGALTGVVTDASKAVVPAANVEIKDAAKGTEQTAKTDREGVYRFFAAMRSNFTSFGVYVRQSLRVRHSIHEFAS